MRNTSVCYFSLLTKSRDELEKYLFESESLRDSEGELLIQYPENFESIVNSMSRQDVVGADEKRSVGLVY